MQQVNKTIILCPVCREKCDPQGSICARCNWVLSSAPVVGGITPADTESYLQELNRARQRWIHSTLTPVPDPARALNEVAMVAIKAYYETVSELLGPYSESTTAITSLRGTMGYMQQCEHGIIYWSLRHGAHAVHHGIGALHEESGGVANSLGFPTNNESETATSWYNTEGYVQHFEGLLDYPVDVATRLEMRCGGSIYWSVQYGAIAIQGNIGICYERMGGITSKLGFPVAAVQDAKPSSHDTHGQYQQFETGFIYDSTQYGTHAVCLGIAEYCSQAEQSDARLGFPAEPDVRVISSFGTSGTVQRFEGSWPYPEEVLNKIGFLCGAAVYWTEKFGAHATRGGIGATYELHGGPSGELGFPITDEIPILSTPHRLAGYYQEFEGGRIYWSERYGAFPTVKDIDKYHHEVGGVYGLLGFPVAMEGIAQPRENKGESDADNGSLQCGNRRRIQQFEGGTICTSPSTGTHAVLSMLENAFQQYGGSGGILGLPCGPVSKSNPEYGGEESTGNPLCNDHEWGQEFEGGWLFWDFATGISRFWHPPS